MANSLADATYFSLVIYFVSNAMTFVHSELSKYFWAATVSLYIACGQMSSTSFHRYNVKQIRAATTNRLNR